MGEVKGVVEGATEGAQLLAVTVGLSGAVIEKATTVGGKELESPTATKICIVGLPV